MNWVTIATFTTPIEAQICQGRLESEGVTASIRDENIVAVNPLYSNAIGGVKIQVKQEDVELALEILSREYPDFDPPTDLKLVQGGKK